METELDTDTDNDSDDGDDDSVNIYEEVLNHENYRNREHMFTWNEHRGHQNTSHQV